jgi:DeoR family transcriptional regulator, fructose operon transcriptional repressor
MKRALSIVNQRRQQILDELIKNPQLNADDLAKILNVSSLTIRRDFQYLEDRDRLHRHYGGATVVESYLDKSNREDLSEIRKNLIAKKAAQFIEDGDTIFINTSSTALLVLKYLEGKKVNVITNNANAVFIKKDFNVNVFLTGGELREPKHSMVGEFAYNNLSRVTANKCFLGCSGISSKAGMTTAVLAEVAINEVMLRQTIGTRFVIAESSKVGHNSSFVSSALNKIHTLITDQDANKEEIEMMKDYGLNVVMINEF